MNEAHYLEIIERFSGLRVLVVGDLYLDENTYGAVTEISLEAPIPVFEIHERRHNPGAAGNAACNAASLGAAVYAVGVVGEDANADVLRQAFAERGVNAEYVVVDPARPTNTYGKLRAGGHQIPTQEVLRVDTPRPTPINGATEARVIETIQRLAPDVDAIMIGDQVASVVTEAVLDAIVAAAAAHDLITVADSRDRAGLFSGVDLVVPNDQEAGRAAGFTIEDEETLERAGRFLLTTARNAFITRGAEGITIFSQDAPAETVPVGRVEVVDVTGAGDTVSAAATLVLACGASLHEAAVIANTAAGVAVQQPGVVTVSADDVAAALQTLGGPPKLKTLDQVKSIMARLKRERKRVVWTNGCFDILHVGHITYLLQAREHGDCLVVGLNSDASVREIKGPGRPVINEYDRALVLSALACVDYIVIFSERSPMPLLEALEPGVYAKGGDYTVDTIDQEERRLVEGYGGVIAIIPGIEGQSTTSIIDRIAQDASDAGVS